ncbi:hypothetical protein WR25_12607 [Diploscapter pachys]|uniref:Uncharacterized protein n=1 Tax=Diploscapter pachys TaxID=2018661 RepID=A0A2A2K2A1_9BILA|nr:hypothetical protein WR25_12607 [Diploscapter pachys]
MSISAATDDAYTTLLQNFCKQASVRFDVCTIGLEFIGQSFTEAHCFTGDGCQVCAALYAWENSRLKLLEEVFAVGHDQAAASTTEGLGGGAGHDVCVWNRRRVHSSSDKSGKVGHVHQVSCANLIGNLSHTREVDFTWVRRATRDDELRLVLQGQSFDVVVVDSASFAIYAIRNDAEPTARLVRLCAVAQVPTRSQIQAQYCVAWLQKCKEHSLVGLGAGVWLHVHEAAAEKFFCAVNGSLLDNVGEISAAVETLAWVAFNGLVGDDRTDGLQRGEAHRVLRGDQFDLALLTFFLVLESFEDQRVALSKIVVEGKLDGYQ